MNKPLISQDEAIQLLNTHAPEVRVIEIVSDYYAATALQNPRLSHTTTGFAQIKTEQLEVNSAWTLKSDQQLQQVLAAAELTPDMQQHILLFDNIQCTCGNLASRFDASARLFSILHYFGFTEVSIIYDAARRLSFPELLTAQCPELPLRLMPQDSVSEPAPQASWLPKHKNHIVNHATLVQTLSGKPGSYRLLDARSAEEFAGLISGYDYVPLAGKIPTAENIINGEYQTSDTINADTVLINLQATLTTRNINKNDRIIWYCGTAWRASRMCVLTQMLGYTNVAIYDGGWHEWQQYHPEDAIQKSWPDATDQPFLCSAMQRTPALTA